MKLPAVILLLALLSFGAIAQEKQEIIGSESGETLEAVTRLQVFLDRAEFSPGKIDGRMGQLTLEALALYREAHGGTATPDPQLNADVGYLNELNPGKTAKIKAGDLLRVVNVALQLNKEGIGIHGTNDPDTIGRSSSHGCVRLANWDVVRLTEKIGAGVPVTIQAGPR